MPYITCIYCGHSHRLPAYPCPECGPEEDAYDQTEDGDVND